MKQTHLFVITLCLFLSYSQIGFSFSIIEVVTTGSERENMNYKLTTNVDEKANDHLVNVSTEQDISKLYSDYLFPEIHKDDILLSSPISNYQSPYYRTKNPAISLLLSLLLPAGGQFYNGHFTKGAVMIGIYAGSFGMIVLGATTVLKHDGDRTYYDDRSGALIIGGVFLCIGNYIWSIIDAPFSSIIINNKIRIGEYASLNIKPDYSFTNQLRGNKSKITPIFGLKLSLNL